MSEKPTDLNPLTALKAACISEEHWGYIVANGGGVNLKEIWPGWHRYGQMRSACALCEYTYSSRVVPGGAAMSSATCMKYCPYVKRFGYTCTQSSSPFAHWVACPSDESRSRLTGAQKFLAQLTELRQYLEAQEFQSQKPRVDKDGWAEVSRHPAGDCFDYRARVEDGAVVTERRRSTKPKSKDITGECTVELIKSQHSDGYYVLLTHNGRRLFVLGLDEKSAYLQLPNSSGYRIMKAKNATVSFNVTK